MMKETTVWKLGLLLFLQVSAGASAATAAGSPAHSCGKDVGANAVVERLADLPADIRGDLLLTFRGMGDRGAPLLQTDAPSIAEREYPTSRFAQALRIKNMWFVQFEVAMSGGRTIGYVQGTDGRFARSPSHYYGGPACETLKAAVNGVITPGGFNF